MLAKKYREGRIIEKNRYRKEDIYWTMKAKYQS